MRILILGGSGMLGHKLYQTVKPRMETYVTLRGRASTYDHFGIFDPACVAGDLVADDFASVQRALAVAKPDVVVNCIGIVKQGPAGKDPIASIGVNSLFPHWVAQAVRAHDARLIHLSTDCVFSGTRGNYAEDTLPDPPDLYGRSKLLGEVDAEDCLTIRTSMIGRELRGSHGIIEWFLSQAGGQVRGFTRAIFSGFTTSALSNIIARIITDHPKLTGIWHVAADPISKFDLLTLVKQTYGLAIEIEPDEDFACDRSLNGTRFHEATGIKAAPWPTMIEQMHADPTPYDKIRHNA